MCACPCACVCWLLRLPVALSKTMADLARPAQYTALTAQANLQSQQWQHRLPDSTASLASVCTDGSPQRPWWL